MQAKTKPNIQHEGRHYFVISYISHLHYSSHLCERVELHQLFWFDTIWRSSLTVSTRIILITIHIRFDWSILMILIVFFFFVILAVHNCCSYVGFGLSQRQCIATVIGLHFALGITTIAGQSMGIITHLGQPMGLTVRHCCSNMAKPYCP